MVLRKPGRKLPDTCNGSAFSRCHRNEQIEKALSRMLAEDASTSNMCGREPENRGDAERLREIKPVATESMRRLNTYADT